MHACKHAKIGLGWKGELRVESGRFEPYKVLVRFKGDKPRPDSNVTPHCGDKVGAQSEIDGRDET